MVVVTLPPAADADTACVVVDDDDVVAACVVDVVADADCKVVVDAVADVAAVPCVNVIVRGNRPIPAISINRRPRFKLLSPIFSRRAFRYRAATREAARTGIPTTIKVREEGGGCDISPVIHRKLLSLEVNNLL